MAYLCPACRLPDPDNGDGDGSETCNCERCVYCAQGPEACDCEMDNADAYRLWDRIEAY